jgi:putative DNA methylase
LNTKATAVCPRLIEVALPIREISAECVRQKKAQRGHISTLHIWWARRPLAASRAVVFASLVPDPDDLRCPPAFHRAVEKYLKNDVPSALQSYRRGREEIHDADPYKPYEKIADSLRNRLLSFIAKWSLESLDFETGKCETPPEPKHLLDDRSLVRWETADPENAQGREVLRIARELVSVANGEKSPEVVDPYAGGGSIVLEAARLGCHSVANDYNPVAYLILRATCEFPQKFGKAGNRLVVANEFGKPVERQIQVPNVLVHDVAKWTNWVRERAQAKLSDLYAPGKDGCPIIGYIWARAVPCSNPSCRKEIPLLRNLFLCKKKDKKVALTLEVNKTRKEVSFGIAKDGAIRTTEGTKRERGPAICPFCDQPTSEAEIRKAGRDGRMPERMVAVIIEKNKGKDYRPVEEADLIAFGLSKSRHVERPKEFILPEINGPAAVAGISHFRSINVDSYGFTTWGSLFNTRQLLTMQTLVECLREALDEMRKEQTDDEYRKAIAIYVGLWLSRASARYCSVTIWHQSEEKFEHPFGRQALPMTWDYPEPNPFASGSAGLGDAYDLMRRVALREREASPSTVLLGDAAGLPVGDATVDLVVTDPPYFDSIAYADLSDYFYVWLKRAIGDLIPEALSTPLTPKAEEATALKHRQLGDAERADRHFRTKLAQGLASSHRILKPGGVVTVMFAHQSNKAWAGLVNAIFDAGLTVDATWPIDTELTTALKASMSALSSSFTVVCRERVVGSASSLRSVREEIRAAVRNAVSRFWDYGLRGADLLVASYGPAVGVFGKYEKVEKADGTPVEIPELLELARGAARDAISGDFRGDNISTLYYLWANLYGASEQKWDDARTLVQIGGNGEDAMEVARGEGILVVNGPECRLALLADRTKRKGLGMDPEPHLVDALHRAMLLWKQENRKDLVAYLTDRDFLGDDRFWKLAQSLFDVLPRNSEDWKLISALLSERETLRTEGKKGTTKPSQRTLGLR